MLLTRLRVFSPDIQIIGLSATVSNAKSLADWLGCILIEITKRNVELREGILYTGSEPLEFRKTHLEKGDFIYKEYNSSTTGVEKKLDLNLVEKIIEQCQTKPCLYFTSTTANSEEIAQQIAYLKYFLCLLLLYCPMPQSRHLMTSLSFSRLVLPQ